MESNMEKDTRHKGKMDLRKLIEEKKNFPHNESAVTQRFLLFVWPSGYSYRLNIRSGAPRLRFIHL